MMMKKMMDLPLKNTIQTKGILHKKGFCGWFEKNSFFKCYHAKPKLDKETHTGAG